ncbi:hypothetical protein ZIOFF_052403 [Zingiber officinale]|uniref:Uncharacterized protein n=1 Tax=Zingiber officinale TaxID=94328 RepID=A0A8J5KNF9_ZINOF|nr:hypothetical protein ZIOFF_052403 [Zingiber officinale]
MDRHQHNAVATCPDSSPESDDESGHVTRACVVMEQGQRSKRMVSDTSPKAATKRKDGVICGCCEGSNLTNRAVKVADEVGDDDVPFEEDAFRDRKPYALSPTPDASEEDSGSCGLKRRKALGWVELGSKNAQDGCLDILMGIEISTYFDLLGSILCRVSSNHDDYFRCESIVRKWADNSNQNEIKESDLNLKDLLLFLHVPRTGGRTYFHCFLRKLYASALECPRSYDKLHFDPRYLSLFLGSISIPMLLLVLNFGDVLQSWLWNWLKYWLLWSSSFSYADKGGAFSEYGFHLYPASNRGILLLSEVLASVHAYMLGKICMSNIFLQITLQRDARRSRRYPKFEEISSPYDMQNMAMPLHEYINHPIAHDIIHNGATFQVLLG